MIDKSHTLLSWFAYEEMPQLWDVPIMGWWCDDDDTNLWLVIKLICDTLW